MYSRLLIALTSICLASCSLSPVNVTPESTYELKTVPNVKPQTKHALTLLITLPETSSVYDTTQMAYTTQPYQIAYFAKNRWVTTPATMLQNLLVQTFQNAHYYQTIVTPPFSGHYDYVLNTRILQLEQDFLQHPSQIRFKVRAQLIRTATNQVVSTKEFQAIESAPQNTPYAGVIAANKAVATVLQGLNQFASQTK